MTKPGQKPDSKQYRRAALAKIHIAKAQLGMDDATYRDMLSNVAGVASAADLDAAGRRAVLEHLSAVGFVQKRKGRPKNMDNPENSKAAQLKKIEALLATGKKPWSYADGIAKRVCKVEKVAWVPAGSLYKVIAALTRQAEREGWDLNRR